MSLNTFWPWAWSQVLSLDLGLGPGHKVLDSITAVICSGLAAICNASIWGRCRKLLLYHRRRQYGRLSVALWALVY